MFKNFFVTAYRNLVKNKATTFLNVAGLSIGIAVCMVIGIWLQRELSFDKFHPERNSIFRLSNTFKSESEAFSQAPSGPAFGAQLPKQLAAIKSACRIFGQTYKLKYASNQFIEQNAIVVDSNFFKFFGFRLMKGDPASALGSPDQIVLTEKLADKYFGKEDPIGKTILVDGEYPMTVSGVAADCPVNSQIQFDLLIGSSFIVKIFKEKYQFDLNNFWVGGWPNTYVQLADPAKPAEAERLINQVAFKFSEKDWKENKMSYYYFLQPLTKIHLQSHLRYDSPNNGSLSSVRIFSIVGIIVLLLACINYINLTTAGAIKRAKETSVRKVVGASRLALIRQFFIETFLICTIAVGMGVFLVKLFLPSFSSWIGQTYDLPITVQTGGVILAFIVGISLIAGIYPAAILSSFRPAIALKGNFIQSRSGNLIRKSLVVFQFTITIALVASILIISRQMNYIRNRSLGFDGNAVVEVKFYGESSVIKQYASLRNQLLGSPFILNVAKHGQNVVGGLGNGWTTTENLKGEEISTSLYQMSVDTNYFDTYNMKLAAGRFFSSSMPTDTIKSIIVNEAAVRTFGWQTASQALGKKFGKGEDTRYVIGVVRDFNFESLHKPIEALMIAYSRQGGSLSLKIDSRHIDEAINHLKKTWNASVPEVPLQYSFVEESIEKQYGNEKKMEAVFYAFAGLSLLIACLGLFGLSIFVVERRVKEIGIRKVLGAKVGGIVGLLSRDFIKLVLIAALIASPIAWYLMHEWLKDFAYRINIAWSIFFIAGGVAMFIALLTVSIRAVKAAVTNPVKSLRTE